MNRLRVIQYERAIEVSKSSLWNVEDVADFSAWIALGQFDLISSYSIDCISGILPALRANDHKPVKMIKPGIFYRLQYLIPVDPREDIAIWNASQQNYLAIIRLHMANTIDVPQTRTSLIEDIKNKLSPFNVRFCIYNSLELSDMALVLQAQTINVIMDSICAIQHCLKLGKTYTYLAINLEKVGEGQTMSLPKDEISYLSMHISAKNSNQMSPILNIFKETLGNYSEYAIAGIDDSLLVWNNVDAYKLFALYDKWIEICRKPNLGRVFLSKHTEVGKEITNISNRNPNTKELVEACRQIGPIFKKLTKNFGDAPWVDSFSALISTTLFMSESFEWDEFVYLVLPAIKAFVINIKKSEKSSLSKQADLFIRNWNHLLQYVMHSEDQLSNYPEILPRIFDVPAIIIEYLLSFLSKCVDVLASLDNENLRSYSKGKNSIKHVKFLLAPYLKDRIQAHELFDVFSNNCALVVINIPFRCLYELNGTLINLGHEVSHFMGEFPRKRDVRYNYYLEAMAALMGKTVFGSRNNNVINGIVTLCKTHISTSVGAPPRKLKDTEDCVLKWIDSILGRNTDSVNSDETDFSAYSDNFVDLIRTIITYEEITDSDAPIYPSSYEILTYKIDALFINLLKDLRRLFRESYADLCMATLIAPNVVDYIKELYRELSGKYIHDDVWGFYAIRIALYIFTVEDDMPTYEAIKDSGISEKFYLLIKRIFICCKVKSQSDIEDIRYPALSILKICDYLQECKEAFSMCNKSKLNELEKQKYSDIGDNIAGFYSTIDAYRKSIIEEIKTPKS